MTAQPALQSVAGLLLGVLATWALVVVTSTLAVPAVAMGAVALGTWLRGRQALAASPAAGALAVTFFFGWLLSTLGAGLATV